MPSPVMTPTPGTPGVANQATMGGIYSGIRPFSANTGVGSRPSVGGGGGIGTPGAGVPGGGWPGGAATGGGVQTGQVTDFITPFRTPGGRPPRPRVQRPRVHLPPSAGRPVRAPSQAASATSPHPPTSVPGRAGFGARFTGTMLSTDDPTVATGSLPGG